MKDLDGLLHYNKDTRDRRRPVVTVSPGERQRRQKALDVVEPIIKELVAQIEDMSEELDTLKSNKGTNEKLYTEAELNEAIVDELTKESNAYMQEIEKLRAEVEEHKKVIETLKTKEEPKSKPKQTRKTNKKPTNKAE